MELTYQFRVLNANHKKVICEQEQQIGGRHIAQLRKGDPVEVMYLPQNPKITLLAGSHWDSTGRYMSTLFAALGIFLFPYLAIVWVGVFLFERFGYRFFKY